MPRITASHMLRSIMKTVSAPASSIISWLTPTPHATAVYAISEGCFYNWKAKYGGLEVSEAKRLPRVSIEVEA